MATTWTEENLGSGSWKDATPGQDLVQEDGDYIAQEDGSSLLGLEGIETDWGEVSLDDSTWNYEGVLIYLATEGKRERLLTEGDTYYIVIRQPGEWSEENLGTAIWTEVSII